MAASRRGKNRGRIRPGTPPGKGRIYPGQPPEEPYIVVSLRYLHPEPPVGDDFPDRYATVLIRCLERITKLRHGELVGQRGSGDHGIDWKNTNVPRRAFEQGLPD